MWSSKHRPTQVGVLGCASSRAVGVRLLELWSSAPVPRATAGHGQEMGGVPC
jgi:hypothetical protein